jgi:hypothetical protein
MLHLPYIVSFRKVGIFQNFSFPPHQSAERENTQEFDQEISTTERHLGQGWPCAVVSKVSYEHT